MNINEVNAEEESDPEALGPNATFRKLIRRIRIAKRLEGLKQRPEGDEEDQKSLLERQVQDSSQQIGKLLLEGKELVTNVRVANDAREVKRREDQLQARENRLKRLEDEAADSMEKFEVISAKWDEISKSNDPLDIFHDMEQQKDKCMELIEQKNQLIVELRKELKKADDRFNRDQRKQKEDLSLLVERIDSQVNVMQRAYRRELKLIEQAIATERRQLLVANSKQWNTLYEAREKDEVANMEKKFKQVEKFETEMHDIEFMHQEKYRESKILLETDIQVLQQELEQVKALCMLNTEKLDYNYQVLKKRDDENIIMKAQQKRRINRLQDVVNGLRKKISETENTTKSETRHLTEDVMRLYHNIVDIERKADYFTEVNDRKYKQIWKMNENTAKELLDKILTTDRILHEQQLGLEWVPPDVTLLPKTDLQSYQSAMQIVAELFKQGDPNVSTNSVSNSSQKKATEEMEVLHAHERLMRHILQRIADHSGFLIEERLKSLLFPYRRCEKTLVKIDNVFSALEIKNEDDMLMLKEFFMPYAHCTICKPPPPITEQETEIVNVNLDTRSGISFRIDSTESSEDSAGIDDQPTNKGMETKDTDSMHHFPIMEAAPTGILQVKPKCPPSHILSIDSIYVLKALREFVSKFSERKESIVVNMCSRLARKRSTVSRIMSEEDVTLYWQRFREIFSPQREKLWDGLMMGLHKYHSILEDRHKLNVETEHLRQQNAELRRLLHRYMLSTGGDGLFTSSCEILPPIKPVNTSNQQQRYLRSVMKSGMQSSDKTV